MREAQAAFGIRAQNQMRLAAALNASQAAEAAQHYQGLFAGAWLPTRIFQLGAARAGGLPAAIAACVPCAIAGRIFRCEELALLLAQSGQRRASANDSALWQFSEPSAFCGR